MTIPSRKEIELPLLQEIEKAGGEVPWRTLFQPVAEHFPGLTGKELENPARLRRARYALFKRGELISKGGVWKITDKGREHLRQVGLLKEETAKPTCKCGCGEIVPQGTMYVPGHDAIHRSKLIDKAGGVDSLQELLRLTDTYMVGEIGESELAKGIRRLRVR